MFEERVAADHLVTIVENGRLTGRETLRYFGRLFGMSEERIAARIEELVTLLEMESLLQKRYDTQEATVLIEAIPGAPLSEAELAANIAYGAQLRSYRFDKYKTKEKPEQKPSLKRFTIVTAEASAAIRAALEAGATCNHAAARTFYAGSDDRPALRETFTRAARHDLPQYRFLFFCERDVGAAPAGRTRAARG